ncbi:hypothetical protein CQW23_07311 [Capsicum baccatum]|uniref:DUF4283 domain-containing protein n=1 Tax=Capsicum baccatum TaxID=33114 RepID=A0A2G2X610_CAPBA|nr:hypothetical protein CQW23_07311 [Capsicum baccatum]
MLARCSEIAPAHWKIDNWELDWWRDAAPSRCFTVLVRVGERRLHFFGVGVAEKEVDMESTLVPVWVILPDFPWHYHDWAAMERILEPLVPLILLDKVTMARTRPTTAKACVEIELTRPRINEVKVALIDSTGKLDTFKQLIEYETSLILLLL